MSEPINDGGPAFPVTEDAWENFGMSLRDYFAGQALAGAISNPEYGIGLGKTGIAEECYSIADAMISAREQ